MNGSIFFVPLTKDGVFFNNPDIHCMASQIFRSGIRMFQQLLTYSTMSVLRQNGKIIQFAFPILLNQERVVSA